MNIEIIAVGTELLLGLANTNGAWLGSQLAALGINVYRQTVVGDNQARVVAAFKEALSRADAIIVTGGLGPTQDDITKEAAASYFGLDMVLDEPSLKRIEAFFESIGHKMPISNKKQAMFPKGARVLDNHNGTAPGCIIESRGKICILLPGPPKEMQAMWHGHVFDYISKFSQGVIIYRDLRLVGIGESDMEEQIADIIIAQKNPTIAPYATNRAGELTLRIAAKAKDDDEAKEMIDPIAKMIYDRLGRYIYGEDDDTLAATVVKMLAQKGLSLSAAESITGGGFAAAIIDVPGASQVFYEGIVCYSNGSKETRLNVRPATLKEHGAVSAQVAYEMAQGVLYNSDADIGISFTGIAGPNGATEKKPVGLCYIGLHIVGQNTIVEEFHLFGDRKAIKGRAVAHGLNMIRKAIIQLEENK